MGGPILHDLSKIKIKIDKTLGYEVARYPDHPNSASRAGMVYIHRLVMENHLNRYLNSDEHVHHKDGNKLNNDISNLELLSNSEHAKEHVVENLLSKQGMKLLDNKICLTCNKEFHPNKFKQKYCSTECNFSHKQKIKWPSIEELKSELENKSMLQLSKELGVSDNAIKKHMKKYE